MLESYSASSWWTCRRRSFNKTLLFKLNRWLSEFLFTQKFFTGVLHRSASTSNLKNRLEVFRTSDSEVICFSFAWCLLIFNFNQFSISFLSHFCAQKKAFMESAWDLNGKFLSAMLRLSTGVSWLNLSSVIEFVSNGQSWHRMNLQH